MITVNRCFNTECKNNDGMDSCECLFGIDIDQDGECASFEYREEQESDR